MRSLSDYYAAITCIRPIRIGWRAGGLASACDPRPGSAGWCTAGAAIVGGSAGMTSTRIGLAGYGFGGRIFHAPLLAAAAGVSSRAS